LHVWVGVTKENKLDHAFTQGKDIVLVVMAFSVIESLHFYLFKNYSKLF
jgi:hypothetical protein